MGACSKTIRKVREMASVLFESAVRATLVAAAVALVLRVMRIESAVVRHAAWVGVIIIMLLLPALVTWGPKASLRVLPPETEQSAMPAPSVLEPSAMPVEAHAGTTIDVASAPSLWTWGTFAVSLYLLGLGAFLLRLAVGTLKIRRLVRTANLDKGKLTHAGCATPVTVGWLKPKTILPADWSLWPQRQLDAILAHEGEHILRRDPLIQWLALLNRAVFWFHPLAWWLERHVSALAEEACDAAVLSRGHDPGEYSEYLLDLARSAARAGRRVPTMGMALPGARLPHRIRQILDGARAPRISKTRLVCTAAVCAIVGATFAIGTLAQAQLAPAAIDVQNQPKTDAFITGSFPTPMSADPTERAGAAQARTTNLEAPLAARISAPFRAGWDGISGRGSVQSRGTVLFTDDLSDVRALSAGGVLSVESRTAFFSSRRVEFRESNGTILRTYYVDGSEQPWNDDARLWLAAELPFLVRRSGVAANEQVQQIIATRGVSGVISEIKLLHTDSVRGRYFRALFGTVRLDVAETDSALSLAGNLISSSSELGETLRAALTTHPLDDGNTFFGTVERISSSVEKRRVLMAVLDQSNLSLVVQRGLLKAAASIESNAECANVLDAFVSRYPITDEATRESFLAALETVDSTHERNRVLTKVVSR
jgi:beta-lactamase regulating signal transducer with metallopeptidase domain